MTGTLSAFYASTEDEKDEVTALVREIYAERFGTLPAPADAYGAIRRGSAVVACLGMEFAPPGERFLVERIYGLDRSAFPLPVTNENTAQFGRLVSREKGLGVLAVYCGIWYAIAGGRRFGIIEHDAAIHRICLEFGIVFADLPYTGIDLEQTPKRDRIYYLTADGRPYLFDLERSRIEVEKRLSPEMRALFEHH